MNPSGHVLGSRLRHGSYRFEAFIYAVVKATFGKSSGRGEAIEARLFPAFIRHQQDVGIRSPTYSVSVEITRE